jgi:hypothetical protein
VVISILDADQRRAQELWHCGDAPGEGEGQKLNTIMLSLKDHLQKDGSNKEWKAPHFGNG